MTKQVEAAAALHSGQYYVRLDGLRGIAVIAVLIEHFTYLDAVRDWAPGMVGVRSFFVLSGFLITSILLREREAEASRLSQAAGFYWRRFVRLSPALLTAVLILLILDVARMREDWWVHLLYLSNFQVALNGYWPPAGHFWTLAVEEQFYLLWFPLVMLAPKRWLLPAILLFIAGAPLYRLMIPIGMPPLYDVLLPGHVDAMAIGALVALTRSHDRLAWIYRWLSDARVMWTSFAITLLLISPLVTNPFIGWPLDSLSVAVSAACLICNCLEGKSRSFAWLANPVLVHIGVISYGIYIFHYFVPQVIWDYFPDLHEWLNSSVATKLLRTAIWTGLSLLVAEASWRLIERPALRYKSLVARRKTASQPA